MTTLASVIGRLKKVGRVDLVQVTGEATHHTVVSFARKQVASSGAYGGEPWAYYASEPRYEAFKQAMSLTLAPLRWQPGRERLVPALTNPLDPRHQWVRGPKGWRLSIALEYLSRIETGGVNQFGERFPARRVFPTRGPLPRDAQRDTQRAFMQRIRTIGFKATR